jgi:hypothetical protein
MNLRLLTVTLAMLLAGCDIPGMGPDPRIAQREADGRAIGGACRYAMRGIEDCYQLNERASKTAIFAGWKDMDQYMRENKMEGQAPAAEKEVIVDDRKSPAVVKENLAEAKPKSADKGKAKASPEKH